MVAEFSCAGPLVASWLESGPDSEEDICLFTSTGLGVPDLLGVSSSPITNSGSNSAGSGDFLEGSPSFLPRAPVRSWRLEGDSSRVAGRLLPGEGLEGDACNERWRACSSAILESIAPLRRYEVGSALVEEVFSINLPGTLCRLDQVFLASQPCFLSLPTADSFPLETETWILHLPRNFFEPMRESSDRVQQNLARQRAEKAEETRRSSEYLL